LCTIVVSVLIARRVAGITAAAVVAVLLLWHSTFVERGIEVRPDIGLALCAMIALYIEVVGWRLLRRHCVQGLALSAAFLFSNKAVVVCFAFGCVWLVRAIYHRRPGLVVLPFALWCVPVAAMFMAFAALGNLEDYLRVNWGQHFSYVSRSVNLGFPPERYFSGELPRNRLFVIAALAGLGFGLGAWIRLGYRRVIAGLAVVAMFMAMKATYFPLSFLAVAACAASAYFFRRDSLVRVRESHGVVAWVGLASLAALWINPFPFPYFHVSIIPPLAILAAILLAHIPTWLAPLARTGLSPAVVVACAVTQAMWSGAHLLDKARISNHFQHAVVREIHRLTEPGDTVFDLIGMTFRRDAYRAFSMTLSSLRRYGKTPDFPDMLPVFEQTRPTIVVASYRTQGLPKRERDWLRQRFTIYAGGIMVPGRSVSGLAPGQTAAFTVMQDRPFRYIGDGTLLVDGRPFSTGTLARGEYVLSTSDGIDKGRLLFAAVADPPPEILTEPHSLFEASDFVEMR
ncbi:MAG: hypothetical protein AAGC55_09915, partial [Myxococcota bacterium]